ncbi:MAG: hypothetical protein ABEI52_00380, partial [Halobacteriaceae archaeon]
LAQVDEVDRREVAKPGLQLRHQHLDALGGDSEGEKSDRRTFAHRGPRALREGERGRTLPFEMMMVSIDPPRFPTVEIRHVPFSTNEVINAMS